MAYARALGSQETVFVCVGGHLTDLQVCRCREGTAQPPASPRNISAPPISLLSSRVPSANMGQAQVRHEQPEFMAVLKQRGKNCIHLSCFIVQAKAGAAGAVVGRNHLPAAQVAHLRLPETARDWKQQWLRQGRARRRCKKSATTGVINSDNFCFQQVLSCK